MLYAQPEVIKIRTNSG